MKPHADVACIEENFGAKKSKANKANMQRAKKYSPGKAFFEGFESLL